MTWSWEDFDGQLGRILDDEAAAAHDEQTRLDGLNAALRAMAAYRPRQASSEHTEVEQIALPADCHRLVAVLATDDAGSTAFLGEATVGEETLGDDGTYWVWEDVLTLGMTYEAVTLFYHAGYPEAAVGDPDIPVPVWAREALLYRAAAYCLAPDLIARARLGAFHDREDAPPLQNSLIQAAQYFIAQFERIMIEHKHAR